MKNLHTHAIFALAFMLGIAVPAATIIAPAPAFAAEQVTGDSLEVADAASLVSAVQNNSVARVVLSSNITLGAAQAAVTIARTTPLVIDLNGFNLSTTNSNVFTIAQGNVTITGSGVISATKGVILVKGSTDSNATNYTVVTINPNVTLRSATQYGLAIMPYSTATSSKDPRCYGVVVNYNGKADGAYGLSIHGNIQESANAPRINIGDTAQLTASGSYEDNAPIYAAGYGQWTIGAATLTGKMGIGLKAGHFTLNGTKLTANGDFDAPGTGTGGIDGTGVAFQIEHHTKYSNEDIVININGGTYTSTNDIFYEYGDTATRSITAAADININGGTFTAGPNHAVFGGDYALDDIVITAGTFSGTDVANFETNGYLADNLIINADGTVVTAPASRPNRPNRPVQPNHDDGANTTISTADGLISVTGKFSADYRVQYAPANYNVASFSGKHHAFYDIIIVDQAGQPVDLDQTVMVSIKVPSDFDGAHSSIYYVKTESDLEQLPASYADGQLSFTTDHLSVYAIVQDGGAATTVPDTGFIQNYGIIGAISTIVPLMIGAGLTFSLYSKRVYKRRQAEILDDMVAEIESQAITSEEASDPVIERFEAVAIERPTEPTGPQVDMFIPKHK